MTDRQLLPERGKCHGCGNALEQSGRGRPRKWCSERCRRYTSYSGVCVDCGTPTYRGIAGTPPERCSPCSNRLHNTVWTAEAIIDAMQTWAREHGGPPTAADWNPNHALATGHPEKAERFHAGSWPFVSTVQARFGSWNAGIAVAGLSPAAPGQYRTNRQGRATREPVAT